jgi:RimJ/RimL family protein N-acetyltransferase
MPTLVGDRIVLRPYRDGEIDTLWDVSRRGVDGFAAEPGASRSKLARRVRAAGRMVGGRIDLAVEAEGRLVGEIDARRPPGALPDGVFEFGIALFREGDRRRGYGREAVILLTRHLFEERAAERVQASTDVHNRPMRGLLEHLGFALEGIMRAFMPVDGQRRDFALYAMTRPDYEDERTRWTSAS